MTKQTNFNKILKKNTPDFNVSVYLIKILNVPVSHTRLVRSTVVMGLTVRLISDDVVGF